MADNWNVVGHHWAVDMLKKHVIHGTARHAYLFAGAPGLGRRTLALRFAQALSSRSSDWAAVWPARSLTWPSGASAFAVPPLTHSSVSKAELKRY